MTLDRRTRLEPQRRTGGRTQTYSASSDARAGFRKTKRLPNGGIAAGETDYERAFPMTKRIGIL
jgi:hypothetical protein